ncbi:MAG: ABC transporter permease [Acidimicrobiia bacterium]|jgi:lipooligosaccharide transport system permease protein
MTARSLRVLEASARNYRRTWRGSVISTFLSPVLFLLAMGVGLGALVDDGGGGLGVPYLTFVAPGLLAATAMQTGAGDGAWPVMAGMKWRKNFHAAVATPVTSRDLVVGHLGWVAIRLAFVLIVYAVAISAFGALTPARALLAAGPALLTGVAFAAATTAYAAALENETGLSNLFRFGIVPLFLFSGTFFPISQLPDWIERVAYATPLWHGVDLSRALALGTPTTLPAWVSVGYLIAMLTAGTAVAMRRFERRLKS